MNMINCPICDYHYSEKRSHCPTCGCEPATSDMRPHQHSVGTWRELSLAQGFERARQLPQSPRMFQLVD